MASGTTVALVTGASRGIGREIARQLAGLGLTTYATARDPAAAERVAAELASEGLLVLGRALDVTDQGSIDRLAAELGRDPGRLDALVNNAGVLLDDHVTAAEPDLELVRRTLETNLLGAWRVTAAFLPLMRRHGHGRIVNVSTSMAQLASMGGGSPGYRTSKTALNALTRALAAELAGTDVLVNSMDPGWVRTDMGGPAATRSVGEGADTAVWLATLPGGGPSGGFFRDREPIPW